MPYTFTVYEGDPAILRLKVRANADPYTLTAEFTRHPYNRFKPETPFLIVPVESDGKDLTIALSANQVDAIGEAYYRIRAVKTGTDIYIESGSITYMQLPPKAEVTESGELILIDSQGRQHSAGSVAGPQGPTGATGATGPAGPPTTLTVGTVTTATPGSEVEVSLTGSAPNQTLNLSIPKGEKGDRGPAGPANTLTIGAVTTAANGLPAVASLTGTSPNQVLHLTIPRGIQGPKGDTGDLGPVGPQGLQGPQGNQGIQGIQGTQGVQGVKGDSGDLTTAVNNPSAGTAVGPFTAAALPSTRTYTLGANATVATLPTPSAVLSGTITFVFKQPATGGPYTVTWPSGITWAGGAPAPTMPTAANARLMASLFWTGQEWLGLVGGTFF